MQIVKARKAGTERLLKIPDDIEVEEKYLADVNENGVISYYPCKKENIKLID